MVACMVQLVSWVLTEQRSHCAICGEGEVCQLVVSPVAERLDIQQGLLLFRKNTHLAVDCSKHVKIGQSVRLKSGLQNAPNTPTDARGLPSSLWMVTKTAAHPSSVVIFPFW